MVCTVVNTLACLGFGMAKQKEFRLIHRNPHVSLFPLFQTDIAKVSLLFYFSKYIGKMKADCEFPRFYNF